LAPERGIGPLNGNAYAEHIDFIDVNGAESLNGTDAKFTVGVNEDMMTQSGVLAGIKMKEVWKRID
jgi:hypothetical protein